MISWLQNWQAWFMSAETRKYVAKLRELQVQYSRHDQLAEVLPNLMEGTPVGKLALALIARTILEGGNLFRLFPDGEAIASEIQWPDGTVARGIRLPKKVYRSLTYSFRHLTGVDLLLRGAVLKGYGTILYEGNTYGLLGLFEPSDDGNETITVRISRVD